MIPSDTELQNMTDAELARLWALRPPYSENHEWVRVAKELRYRKNKQEEKRERFRRK